MSDKKKLVEKLGEKFGVEPSRLLATLKATAFKQKDGREPTNEQMMSLLVVADQYGLNPFTKELYAYPDRNGIIPVVGVDGWSRIINANPEFDGMEFQPSEQMVEMDGAKPAPASMTCVIYRKDRGHPVAVTEYLDEVYRPPFKTRQGAIIKGPWQTHTKRLLRHKAMIQACRLAFGLVGIYDQDEAERIVESEANHEESEWDRKYGGVVTVANVDGKPVEPVSKETVTTEEKEGGQDGQQATSEKSVPPVDAGDLPQDVKDLATAIVARVQQTKAWEAAREWVKGRLTGEQLAYVLAQVDVAEQAANKIADSGKEAA
jgi:phage recombination protein Bet